MNETDSVFLLTKMFQNQQYANDFRNGKLFANSLSYFQNMETQGGQADPDEGATWSGENDILTLSFSPNDSISITRDDLMEPMKFQRINHVNVVCFHAWKLPIIKTSELPSTSDRVTRELQIPKRLQREFGDYAVVICNRNEFFNRIQRELNRQYLNGDVTSFKAGLVQYADYRPLYWDIYGPDVTQNKFLNAAFHKRASYKYQEEYRIAIERRFVVKGGAPCVLNIGDISDITMSFMTSKPLALSASLKS